MKVLEFIVYDIFGEAAFLLGLIALIGLLLQKKKASQVITGVIKTIVGYLLFNIGSGAAQQALVGFQTLFTEAFGLVGVTPISEAVTAQAQTLFPAVIALIMVLGFVMNLLIARFTKFKYVFLTGQHNLFLSALVAILLKALGLGDIPAGSRGETILNLVSQVEAGNGQTVIDYRTRLENKLKEVLANTAIDESRILTEAAIFADKVAVDEETVRLRSHLEQMNAMLTSGGAIGRKLDFLLQEMNRESNTIGSKCSDVRLARIVVDIKAELEKIREQTQNIE